MEAQAGTGSNSGVPAFVLGRGRVPGDNLRNSVPSPSLRMLAYRQRRRSQLTLPTIKVTSSDCSLALKFFASSTIDPARPAGAARSFASDQALFVEFLAGVVERLRQAGVDGEGVSGRERTFLCRHPIDGKARARFPWSPAVPPCRRAEAEIRRGARDWRSPTFAVQDDLSLVAGRKPRKCNAGFRKTV